AAIAAEVIHGEVRHERLSVVSDNEEPRRDVRVLPDGWTTAGGSIVIRLAKLAECAAHVPAPVVLERDVNVGVVGCFERKSISGPVLPPVVVPVEPVVEIALLAIVVSDPCAPVLLVSTAKEAQVVAFES